MGICESCSVCGGSFDVQFRYQMEERDGGFAFYCSQGCLERSQTGDGADLATCDACSRRFRVELAAHLIYVRGARRHACSMDCRNQLARETAGARLGDATAPAPSEAAPVEAAPAPTTLHAVEAPRDPAGMSEAAGEPSASCDSGARAELSAMLSDQWASALGV